MPVTVRVPSRAVPVAATAAVLLAAGGAWTAWGGAGYRVDGPPPESITVDGAQLALGQQQPLLGVTAAPGDARLAVAVTTDSFDPCTVTTVRVLEQDDDAVTLAAYAYRPADAADDCTAGPGEVTVDLGTPLGGRRVVEDGTEHVLVTGEG